MSDLAVGDRVLGWADQSYAERCAVKAELLVPLPAGMDYPAAAALPLVGLTGLQLILLGADVKPGQSVLVTGALGSVGRAAIYAARLRDARIVAGVHGHQVDAARELDVAEVVALDDPAAVARLQPVDVVANTLRGPIAALVLGTVKPGGIFASVTGLPDHAAARSDIKLVNFVSHRDRAGLARLALDAAGGDLVLPVGTQFALKDAAEAHRALERGGSGKIILIP